MKKINHIYIEIGKKSFFPYAMDKMTRKLWINQHTREDNKIMAKITNETLDYFRNISTSHVSKSLGVTDVHGRRRSLANR